VDCFAATLFSATADVAAAASTPVIAGLPVEGYSAAAIVADGSYR
jgi:hypothetical protein